MKIYLQRCAAYFSKLDYAAPAWQPWLSKTNLTNLDCLQNRSLQLITGKLVSTPLEALWLEADVQSYSTCSKCLIVKAIKKARHSTDNHPKCIALDVAIPTPSKLLKFLSKSRRTLVSLATWSSTQTKHHSFSFSTMAAKLLSYRTNLHLCPRYYQSSWWQQHKTTM